MKYFIAIVLATITISANGQSSRFVLGIEGGPGIAGLRGNTIVDDHALRLGYTGGLFAQYNFQPHFSIRTGCYYERKGSAFDLTLTDINGNALGQFSGRQNFDYLSVPLLLKLNFGKKIQWFVNTGPFIGFLMKQTEYSEAFQIVPEMTTDLTDLYKSTEFGLSFGAGVNYPLNEKSFLSFEVRNNLGLSDVSGTPIISNGVIKTNSANFLIGFNYMLGKRAE